MRFSLPIFFALLLTVSCGRPQDERKCRAEYDLQQSEQLISAGEALLEEKANWEKLSQSGIFQGKLGAILKDEVSRRELYADANALLQQERFHDLASLIDNAEKQGHATPALLELRGLPQALQAFSLFCARRPYQDSRALEQSLAFLEPWCAELARLAPQAFPPFLESQRRLLEELRNEERQKKISLELQHFGWSLVTDSPFGPSPEEILARMASLEPQAGILQYMTPEREAVPDVEERLFRGKWDAARELAAVVLWQKLSEGCRERIGKQWMDDGAPLTLAGRVQQARVQQSPALFLEALRLWQNATPSDAPAGESPSFLPEALKLLVPESGGAANPSPGVAECLGGLSEAFP